MSVFLSMSTTKKKHLGRIGLFLAPLFLGMNGQADDQFFIENSGVTKVNQVAAGTGDPPYEPTCDTECLERAHREYLARKKEEAAARARGEILVNPRDVLPEDQLGQIEFYEKSENRFKRSQGLEVEEFLKLQAENKAQLTGACVTPGKIEDNIYLPVQQADPAEQWGAGAESFDFSDPNAVFFDGKEAERKEGRKGPTYSALIKREEGRGELYKHYKRLEPREHAKDRIITTIMEKKAVTQFLPEGKKRIMVLHYCMYFFYREGHWPDQ